MNIQHILVPVDFSEGTPGAIRTALALADKFSARITLCHILQPVLSPVYDLGYAFQKEVAVVQDNSGKELRELARSISSGRQVDTAMETGIPWDCIVNRAAKHNVDLIVMATHGRSGLKHLMLGSVAERVVQHAPCPVLVVRERSVPEPGNSH